MSASFRYRPPSCNRSKDCDRPIRDMPAKQWSSAKEAIDRAISKFRAGFLLSFQQPGRRSDTLRFAYSAERYSQLQTSPETVVAQQLRPWNQHQWGKEHLDQDR